MLAAYTFGDVMWSMLVFFAWIMFFWLLFIVFGDLFSRHDISGWGKAGWTIFAIILPFLGIFVYLIANGKSMGERAAQRAQAQQSQMDNYVRSVRLRLSHGPDRQGQAAPRLRCDHAGGVRPTQGQGARRLAPATGSSLEPALAPEPSASADAEALLDGPVFLAVLLRCPDEGPKKRRP